MHLITHEDSSLHNKQLHSECLPGKGILQSIIVMCVSRLEVRVMAYEVHFRKNIVCCVLILVIMWGALQVFI